MKTNNSKLAFYTLVVGIIICTPILLGEMNVNAMSEPDGFEIITYQNFVSPLNESFSRESYTKPEIIEPISIENGSLVLEEYSNAYAHVETEIGEFSLLELKVRVSSGNPGAVYGPGIGLWINESYSFHFCIGHLPEALRFSYVIGGNWGQTYLPLTIPYDEWFWLRVNLTVPTRVFLEYSQDGENWLDFHEGSVISSGENLTILSFPSDFTNGGLLIIGKGVSIGFQGFNEGGFAVGTKEFNTYYSKTTGSMGVSEIDYFSVLSDSTFFINTFDFPVDSLYSIDSYTIPVRIEPISIENGSLILEEYSNAYAHVETEIGEFSLLELKVRVSSGNPGAIYGPGIGLWINESYSFHFCIGHLPEALRFSYVTGGNWGQTYLPLTIPFDEWFWLRVNLTVPTRVFLEYSQNGENWSDFHEGSVISSGENLTTLSFPSDFTNGGLLIIGKGVSIGFQGFNEGGFAVGTEEFNTYYSKAIGSMGVSEIDYYSVYISKKTNTIIPGFQIIVLSISLLLGLFRKKKRK